MDARILNVRLVGDAVRSHRISVDDFGRLIHNVQLAVKRLGQRIAGQEGKRQGRLPKDIESACSLDILAIEPGSVVVQLGLPRPKGQGQLFGDTGEQAVERLLDGMAMLSGRSKGWPKDFDPSVVDPMLEVGKILGHGVERIDFNFKRKSKAARAVSYTAAIRTRIEKRIESPVPEQVAVVGFLLEVDFKDKTAEIHEALGPVVKIKFEESLEDIVLSGAKRQVKVIGTAERNSDGRVGRLQVIHLEVLEDFSPGPLEPGLFVSEVSAGDDPFRGARPLTDISLLVGGLPDTRNAEEIIRDLGSLRKARRLDK